MRRVDSVLFPGAFLTWWAQTLCQNRRLARRMIESFLVGALPRHHERVNPTRAETVGVLSQFRRRILAARERRIKDRAMRGVSRFDILAI